MEKTKITISAEIELKGNKMFINSAVMTFDEYQRLLKSIESTLKIFAQENTQHATTRE